MALSEEWVKQLIFDAFGSGFDFAEMKIAIVPHDGSPVYRILYPLPAGSWPDDYDYEEIDLRAWADPINMEISYIGYGPRTNTAIARAETIPIKGRR